jgi:MraZ protein
MELLFTGEDEYAVDDRGRMLVPPSYKAALTDTIVMGRGAKGQLWVYPKPLFAEYLQKLRQTPLEEQDADFEDALRFMLAGKEIEFDKQGRLSIPPFLRKLADITASAIVLGNGDRVELWKPERYAEFYGDWVTKQRDRKDAHPALRRSGFRL